jgi:hypothetical protein
MSIIPWLWTDSIQSSSNIANVSLSELPDSNSVLNNSLIEMSSDYHRVSDSAWAPYKTAQTYTLPDRVFEQYERAEVSTSMGLFAELNHAWVTVDNCLYLWDYTHPNPELIGYEDNEHSITAVKLVAPKPGVFVKDINYMLVIATSADMFLLGVAAQFSANGATTVNLYQTRMQFSLRGTEAHVIAGAANGRIFFAGSTDGDIYELYYQPNGQDQSLIYGLVVGRSPRERTTSASLGQQNHGIYCRHCN